MHSSIHGCRPAQVAQREPDALVVVLLSGPGSLCLGPPGSGAAGCFDRNGCFFWRIRTLLVLVRLGRRGVVVSCRWSRHGSVNGLARGFECRVNAALPFYGKSLPLAT